MSRERKVLKGVSLRPAGEGGRGVGEGVGGRASRGESRSWRSREEEEKQGWGGIEAGKRRSWEEEKQEGTDAGRRRNREKQE